jgi:hypothetical protein
MEVRSWRDTLRLSCLLSSEEPQSKAEIVLQFTELDKVQHKSKALSTVRPVNAHGRAEEV